VQFSYARVSTSDQTAAHQLQQARAAGFDIDEDNVIKDEGVSGVSTCFAEREGGRRLVDKLRRGDVLVVRWLDRLGRNYDDVRDTDYHAGRQIPPWRDDGATQGVAMGNELRRHGERSQRHCEKSQGRRAQTAIA
jgi:hypothetical protein